MPTQKGIGATTGLDENTVVIFGGTLHMPNNFFFLNGHRGRVISRSPETTFDGGARAGSPETTQCVVRTVTSRLRSPPMGGGSQGVNNSAGNRNSRGGRRIGALRAKRSELRRVNDIDEAARVQPTGKVSERLSIDISTHVRRIFVKHSNVFP